MASWYWSRRVISWVPTSSRCNPAVAVSAMVAATAAATTVATTRQNGGGIDTSDNHFLLTSLKVPGTHMVDGGTDWNLSQLARNSMLATSSASTYHGFNDGESMTAHPSNDSNMSSSSTVRTNAAKTASKDRLIFLGTGSSSGCPLPLCPLVYRSGYHSEEGKNQYSSHYREWTNAMEPYCRTSNVALNGSDPALNKDYRNNTSLLLSKCHGSCPTECSNVIIDVGKTFREAAMRWLPRHGVASLDAILLTHAHMDACAGLDDVRGFQKWTPRRPKMSLEALSCNSTKGSQSKPMPLFLSQGCLDQVLQRFPWLFQGLIQQQQDQVKHARGSGLPSTPLPRLPEQPIKSTVYQETKSSENSPHANPPFNQAQSHPTSHDVSIDQTSLPEPQRYLSANTRGRKTRRVDPEPVIHRHVASFDVTVFEPFLPFEVAPGIKIIPLPVMHGEDLVTFGFAFTLGQTNVVYFCDISRMLPVTLDFIRRQLPPTDILILDALHPVEKNAVHFSLEQAIELVHLIQPRQQTLLVGMSCDSYPPHDLFNEQMARERVGSCPIQFAHDGLVIEM